MVIVAFMSVLSTFMVLEALERAKILKSLSKSTKFTLTGDRDLVNDFDRDDDREEGYFDNDVDTLLRLELESPNHGARSRSNSSCVRIDVEQLKGNASTSPTIEIPELCHMFLGSTGRSWYLSALALYIYGALSAYCTVFAQSLSAHVPVFNTLQSNYNMYLAIFFVCVVPLSCMELEEQIELQVVLAVCRVFMFICLTGSVILANADTDVEHAQDGALSGFIFADFPDAPYGAPLVNWSGVVTLLPLAAFANIFHHSIPALAKPVKNKLSVGTIFVVSVFCCFLSYSFIGITLATYFGSNIPTESNLIWTSFLGSSSYVAVASTISYYVVLFPALDVSSAFPLNAITLGNNMFVTFRSYQICPLFLSGTDQRVLFRVIAAVPPFIVAAFVSDLGEITSYTGLAGFLISMVFPALLSIKSRYCMEKDGLSTKTKYSNACTSEPFVFFLLFSGVAFTLIFISEKF
jgi:hypothetical protein